MATRRLDKVFSDIRADMASHPVSDDLLLHNNEASIETSIKNLLLTDRYERLMQPRIGSDLKAMLFENFSAQTERRLADAIRETIENYEPRCNLMDVMIEGDPDRNQYLAVIEYAVRSSESPQSFSIILDRVR